MISDNRLRMMAVSGLSLNVGLLLNWVTVYGSSTVMMAVTE